MANSKCENTDYWFGAEDLDNDGIWTWTTSGNPVVYSNWWSNPGSLKVSKQKCKPKINTFSKTD